MNKLPLALAALLATAASAQSAFVRDAGPYATVDAFDPLRLGDDQLEVGVGGGWRFGNGLDAGVRLGAAHTTFDDPDRTLSESRRWALDVEAGYTAWLGARSGLRLGVGGGLQQTLEVGAPTYIRDGSGVVAVVDRGNQDVNVGRVGVSVAGFRRIALGRLAVQPTAGLFLGGRVEATADAAQPFTLRADAGRRVNRQSRTESAVGITASLPVLVRVRGLDLALEPHGAYDVMNDRADAGLRLRVNL